MDHAVISNSLRLVAVLLLKQAYDNCVKLGQNTAT